MAQFGGQPDAQVCTAHVTRRSWRPFKGQARGTVLLCESSTFLKLLLFWVPLELVHSIIFAANHLNIAKDLCVVDLRM